MRIEYLHDVDGNPTGMVRVEVYIRNIFFGGLELVDVVHGKAQKVLAKLREDYPNLVEYWVVGGPIGQNLITWERSRK